MRSAQRGYNVADERAARQLSDSDDDAPHIQAQQFQQTVVDPRRQALRLPAEVVVVVKLVRLRTRIRILRRFRQTSTFFPRNAFNRALCPDFVGVGPYCMPGVSVVFERYQPPHDTVFLKRYRVA